MIAKLAYGNETRAVDLRGLRIRPLAPRAPVGVSDAGTLVAQALDQPADGPRLTELCRGKESATVIVPDATRAAALPEVLPVLLQRLHAGGVPYSGVTVLVACGTHPAAAEEKLPTLLGPLPDGVSVVQHDSRDPEVLTTVGELEPGRFLRLNCAAVAADLLITVGTVRHHYFAGFGGGPKMVFPGVAGHDETQRNHSRVLALSGSDPQRHPGCEPGVLEGNPVAEEIARAADACPPHLSLSLVPGCDGRMAWAAAGSWRASFGAAVEKVRFWYEVDLGPFRLVVASGGGHPADASLIQAHKALDAACRFLGPAGEVLFVAHIGDGAGSPDMEPFLADPRPEAIVARLAGGWVQYGHTTLRLVEKTKRYRVHLHSELAPDLGERLGFRLATRIDDVIERWRVAYPGETVGVMASGTVFPASPEQGVR